MSASTPVDNNFKSLKLEDVYRKSLTVKQLKEIMKNDLIFYSISWHAGDITYINEETNKKETKLEIYACGVIKDTDISVTVRILNFKPYFYVEIPENWSKITIEKFIKYMKEKIWGSSYKLEKRHKFYPYTNLKLYNFLRCSFNTEMSFNFARKLINETISGAVINDFNGANLNLYETKVKTINRFCHNNNISTMGYLRISKYDVIYELNDDFPIEEQDDNDIATTNFDEYGKTQIVVSVNHDKITEYISKDLPHLRVLSWDIECNSSEIGAFPNPKLADDFIAQIGITLLHYDTKKIDKMILTLGTCDPIDDVIVIECKTEKELLIKYLNIILNVDPDVIIGYNIWNFDDNYLVERLKYNRMLGELTKYSRLKMVEIKDIKTKEMSSSARGNNKYIYIDCPGRVTLDLIVIMRTEEIMESYSLDNVAKEFLKDNKIDLEPKVLFEKIKGTSSDRADIAKYCIHDTFLVIELLLKKFKLVNYIEMAKVTCVPLDYLLFRGQQCKAFSLIVKECTRRNFAIPDSIPIDENLIDFQGATVKNPKIGAHYVPVAGLDFASLYPSIIIAYNLCPSTILLDKNNINKEHEFHTIEWDNYSYTFLQNTTSIKQKLFLKLKKEKENISNNIDSIIDDDDDMFKDILDEYIETIPLENSYIGILPSILIELWQGRKATKKLMAQAKENGDYDLEKIYDGKQLAQKLTMNSIYGFLGAEGKGMLACKPIAACVTATGRKMIDQVEKLVNKYYPNAVVYYGDSIPGYEKIPILNSNNSFDDIEISKLLGHWKPYRLFKIHDKDIYGKEYFEPENLYTLSKSGSTKIKKVIRHKVPSKKLYKISVKDDKGNISSVIVTEGHSLIKDDGSLADPTKLKIGDKLYKSFNQ